MHLILYNEEPNNLIIQYYINKHNWTEKQGFDGCNNLQY